VRHDRPKKVLVLGSGALQIGQAGEFDYSGSQALKAFAEEGVATVLINPNIATVQTDKGLAGEVYFLPVDPWHVEQILEREKCDAIALSFGGQTALNCGLALEASGVLARLGVRVLGTPVSAIRDTEDRKLFVDRLDEINVCYARGRTVHSVDAALEAARTVGYPVMMRSGFALGGLGSGIVRNDDECLALATQAFMQVSQVLVEECLYGWKEIEYEVVRDAADNCITVCNMENIDPMGIHTGESVVVAPSQTLDNTEYNMLRDVAMKTVRHLGIVGECNIQYALDPKSRAYRVIEVNARLSRSSALASKATGYPLAYVAAKIALGYTLPEIKNKVTEVTTAFFEPALDYIVCKMPRWDLQKFSGSRQRLGSEMKSVGEVMAIGRTFPEALQKAMRMLELGADGFDPNMFSQGSLYEELENPTPRRFFALAKAFYDGMSVDDAHKRTYIDPFFLGGMKALADEQRNLSDSKTTIDQLPVERLRMLKVQGFSDVQLAKCLKADVGAVRARRHALGIRPKLLQIDTLAAEFPAKTNFLYLTYSADSHNISQAARPSVLVLGSGCYRIGSSVEFDWCAVSAVRTARQLGYEAMILNSNPETVSTDYDMCDRLVFDEISVENVLELYDFERPAGVVVSMGGQTPNNLVLKLHASGVKILGTSPESIDTAEDRNKFSSLLDELGISQPRWAMVEGEHNLDAVARALGGFPVLVRPSYVLSGAAMRVADTDAELRKFVLEAEAVARGNSVVLTKFEEGAKEIEFDGVAERGSVVLEAISEHVEEAGVHSGDATLMHPAQTLLQGQLERIKDIGWALAKRLAISGPFNIQFLVKGDDIKVIELNLRASRSFPFVSKTLGVNFIEEAMRGILGLRPTSSLNACLPPTDYLAVKAPQFSFTRIKGADPRLGVEMASTGEVACFGRSKEEALLKAYRAVGFKIPSKGVLFCLEQPSPLAPEKRLLLKLGFEVYERCTSLEQVSALFKEGRVDWVVAVPKLGRATADYFGRDVRRLSVDAGVNLTTNLQLFRALLDALVHHKQKKGPELSPWSHYVLDAAAPAVALPPVGLKAPVGVSSVRHAPADATYIHSPPKSVFRTSI